MHETYVPFHYQVWGFPLFIGNFCTCDIHVRTMPLHNTGARSGSPLVLRGQTAFFSLSLDREKKGSGPVRIPVLVLTYLQT